jgi:hypothetical protein
MRRVHVTQDDVLACLHCGEREKRTRPWQSRYTARRLAVELRALRRQIRTDIAQHKGNTFVQWRIIEGGELTNEADRDPQPEGNVPPAGSILRLQKTSGNSSMISVGRPHPHTPSGCPGDTHVPSATLSGSRGCPQDTHHLLLPSPCGTPKEWLCCARPDIAGRDVRTTDLIQFAGPRKSKMAPEEYRRVREAAAKLADLLAVALAEVRDGSGNYRRRSVRPPLMIDNSHYFCVMTRVTHIFACDPLTISIGAGNQPRAWVPVALELRASETD